MIFSSGIVEVRNCRLFVQTSSTEMAIMFARAAYDWIETIPGWLNLQTQTGPDFQARLFGGSIELLFEIEEARAGNNAGSRAAPRHHG
jgi:hypothetical protein